jgi:O-antigen/teichoic acid export membrane protein
MGRILGPAEYGIFGVILSLNSILLLFLSAGVPNAVAKLMAEDEKNSGMVLRSGLLVQGMTSLGFFACYWLAAPFIATVLGDASLTDYIRFSSFIIPFTALQALYTLALTGNKQFNEASTTNIVYAVAKFGISIGLVLLGFGIYGAIGGYVAGALFGLVAAFLLLRKMPPGGFAELGPIAKLALSFIAGALMLSLFFSLDLLMVKSLTGDNGLTGFYTSASTVARVPYYLFTSLGALLLPIVSSSLAAGKREHAQQYLAKIMRYLLLALLPVTIFFAVFAWNMLSLFYGPDYYGASVPLSILVFGSLFLAVSVVMSSALAGAGKPHLSAAAFAAAAGAVVISGFALIPAAGIAGAALSSLLGSLLALAIMVALVKKEIGIAFDWASLAKMAAGGAFFLMLAVAIAQFNPRTLLLPVVGVALFGLYALFLILIGEIRRDDFGVLRRAMPDSLQKMADQYLPDVFA